MPPHRVIHVVKAIPLEAQGPASPDGLDKNLVWGNGAPPSARLCYLLPSIPGATFSLDPLIWQMRLSNFPLNMGNPGNGTTLSQK